MAMAETYTKLVDACDSFPYTEHNSSSNQQNPSDAYFKFHLDGVIPALGFILPEVAQKFESKGIWERNDAARTLTFKPENPPNDTLQAAQHRTDILAKHLQHLKENKAFKVLSGWRNELYPVYGPDQQLLFSMERSASALFGIVTYGVHMTAYVETSTGMKIWTPRRSPTKQTYPDMMDNTVAGGLSTGEQPFECLIREAMEEASLPVEIVQNARAVGTMTYFYIREPEAGGEVGLCQPECQYVYDLVLPEDVKPYPGDNEAVDFQLLSVEEIKNALADGKFKPNCALLLVDFFVRHGIITSENQPDYLDIVSRLHRRLEFPLGQVRR